MYFFATMKKGFQNNDLLSLTLIVPLKIFQKYQLGRPSKNKISVYVYVGMATLFPYQEDICKLLHGFCSNNVLLIPLRKNVLNMNFVQAQIVDA